MRLLNIAIASYCPLASCIRFAVVTALLFRETDPWFLLPERTSLQSVVNQTFTNWTLVVVGDGLSEHHVVRAFGAMKRAGLPKSKIIFNNKPAYFREQNYYNRHAIDLESDCVVWCFAGINSYNTALEIAESLHGITHIAHIDDDDRWSVNHLTNLERAFRLEAVDFAFSQATGYTGDTSFPAATVNNRDFELRPPEPCGIVHSTTSWSISGAGWIRYRHPWEQKSSKRSAQTCCGRNPCSGALPADADMWERFRGLVLQNRTSSGMIVQADTIYSNSSIKDELLARIRIENASYETDFRSYAVFKRSVVASSRDHGAA